MRYKLLIEYEGSTFCGWQRQSGQRSVQAALEEAIERFCGVCATVYGAGRTDSGVHALAQVAHVDLPVAYDVAVVRDAVNFHLGGEAVAVLKAVAVSQDFDARFCAIGRQYLYRILRCRAPLVLEKGRAWRVPVPLDVGAMREAAGVLIGYHDFTTFRAAACQAKSPLKTLDRIDILEKGNRIDLYVSARSFMHKQVRSMVGVLKLVGEGKWTTACVQKALEARDRAACGLVAPACGLYLCRIDYPSPWDSHVDSDAEK